MQLRVTIIALLMVWSAFTGAEAKACTLALGSVGTLDLSMDGTILGSQEGLGTSASVTILAGLGDTITIGPPVRVASPGGYNSGAESLEVAYTGLGGLSGVMQGYTTSGTSFSPGLIPLSTLLLENRIVNPNGFAAGSYSTRTVITCS